MIRRLLPTTAVVLAAAQMASAQTFTKCNPTQKKCPDDPALGGTVTVDFTKGKNDFFDALDGTSLTYDNSNGAVFTINKESDAPTLQSNKYIFFGKVDITVRASQGVGVVTSSVLQSDDLDEIDWEWLGGDKTQVQTNYFGKGDTTTYDRGAYHPVNDPQDDFHTYTIDWTKDYVKWYIDGSLVRTLNYADAKDGSRFPQTPMQIKLGTWVAGGKDSPKGTVEWAGGYTDFSQAPFLAYYKSITVQDYSNGVKGATSYSWGDGSDGSYQSIKVLTDGGEVSASSTAAAPSSKTASPSDSGSGIASSTGTNKDASATPSGTTLTTATTARSGGLTQATDGSDVDTTVSTTGTETISTPAATGNSAASSSTSAPPSSGAIKHGSGSSLALIVASAILGLLML